MQPSPLTSAPEPDFSLLDRRAKSGEPLSVVFLGGSLTWGAQATDPQKTSYRALVAQKLAEAYPSARFTFHDAAIGGTGSQLAAFRLERDVLAYRPDLVFLDFTINDDPYAPPHPHRLAAYESLIRRLTLAGTAVVQMILPARKDLDPNEVPRPLDAKHKEIGASYGLPLADAVDLARRRAWDGKTTADVLWDVPDDATHPGDAGYALYAEAARNAFVQAVEKGTRCRVPASMIAAPWYMNVVRYRLTQVTPRPPGWEVGKPHRNAIAYDFICSRWMDDLLIARGQASPLRLKFHGCDVLLFGEQTKTSGDYAVRIDGGEPRKFSAVSKEGNMRLVQVLAEGLDLAAEHEIEITPLLNSGEELRLESLCVAGDGEGVREAD
jgi:lysophospholipase L1-like esterase